MFIIRATAVFEILINAAGSSSSVLETRRDLVINPLLTFPSEQVW